MNPTVTGAVIAGGAALIGFGASAITNGATLRANRRLARDQLLWQKKTKLYEAIDRAIRFDLVFGSPLTSDDHEALREYRRDLDDLDTSTRLYASPKVNERFDELQKTLRILSTCAEKFQDRALTEANLNRQRLAASMRSDLQGPETQTPWQWIERRGGPLRARLPLTVWKGRGDDSRLG